MKKLVLLFTLILSMAFAGLTSTFAQGDDDLFDDKKDTVSIDDMDPVFYEAQEAESGSSTLTIIIIAGIVVVGAGVYYFTKKKK